MKLSKQCLKPLTSYLYIVAITLCLSTLTACGSDSRQGGQASTKPTHHEQTEAKANVPDSKALELTAEQQRQLLEMQMQYMLMMQALQQQQQINDRAVQSLRNHGQIMSDFIEEQSAINACAIAGNCHVERVPLPD